MCVCDSSGNIYAGETGRQAERLIRSVENTCCGYHGYKGTVDTMELFPSFPDSTDVDSASVAMIRHRWAQGFPDEN